MTYPSEVLADGAQAYWRVDETSGTTAADSSGNSRTATYTGTFTLGTTGLLVGDSNAAVTFDANGRLSIASAAWMDTDFVTAEVRFKPTNTTNQWIIGRDHTGATTELAWRLDVDSGKFRAICILQGSSTYRIVTGTTSLVSGTTYTVGLTYDGSNLRLYVNGASEGTPVAASGVLKKTGVAINIARSGGSLNGLIGTLDEVSVTGTALSAARMADRHTAATTTPSTTVTLAGTLQAKTAAFTVATVLAASLVGTMQPKTAAFAMDVPAAPDRTVDLAGELQRKTAAFEVLTSTEATLAGTLRPKTAAFSLLAAADVTLAGTLQAKTAAFSMENSKTLTLAGSLRRKTSAITFVSNPAVTLAATLRPKTAAFTVDAQPTAWLAGTLQPKIATFTTYVVTPVTPAPIIAAAHSMIVGRAFGAVTMQGSQPVYSISAAEIPRARQRIIVDGQDITYFRGGITPNVTYTLLEPLLYGPATLDLPQVSACFERPGAGALAFLRPGANVEVQRVLDDVVVGTDYKGVIVAFDLSGRNLSVELGGEASGRASLRNRQVPIFARTNDLGRQFADSIRDLGLPFYPHLGPVTGIEAMTTGGTGHLEHIQNIVAKAWTRAGRHWTIMPDEATGVYEAHRKDDTTIHGTVFIDDARTVANLRRDIAEEPNRIYASGVTPKGQRVRFGVYPGLIQGPTPDFPGHMELGDSGDGVRLLIGKLHAMGYLKLTDVAGGYDQDVYDAVVDLQIDAGLFDEGFVGTAVPGEVNLTTWNALYDLGVTGNSLEWANIQPAAQRRKVRPWNRSASGGIMGVNPLYDPNHLVRDRNVEINGNRSQMREFSRTVLHDSDDPNWVGDVTFHTGALLRGTVAIGASITTANVMDARELRPGMNLMLPQFDGGTLVHIAAIQVDDEGIVTATVDTRFRDAMEVWEVIARNKESRNDPARQRQQKHRSSTIVKDSIGEWDEIGGLLGNDVPLEAGWNVFEVIGAMEGTVRQLRLMVGDASTVVIQGDGDETIIENLDGQEFACAVFGRSITADRLNNMIPAPLTVAGTKMWETKRAELKERWLLYSAGTHDEPCGYSPGRKHFKSVDTEEPNPDYNPDTDPDSAKVITVTTQESWGEVTGKHVDDAGFAYRSETRTVLHVAVWVRNEATLLGGRIMWPQLEAGA